MSDPRARLSAALADRYRIERELGEGGMAIVYLAEDLKHGRKVALKVLRPELAGVLGPGRFLREIETAAGLSHPHILPLFDSGEADGLLFYVMPYVSGESLRERLEREGPLDLEETLRIVDQVAGALGRAHERGVVHRDVKPANILFEAGQALVADFGIARAIDTAGGEKMTHTGLAVGTPAYMSPEQAGGEADLDARSDVYGLACVAYEMLAGEPPFAGPTPHAVLARQAMDERRALSDFRPDVPQGLEDVLARALARAPSDRFATVTALAAALREATTTAAIERETRRRRRARMVRGLAATAVLTGVVAGGGWLVRSVAGSPIERLAVLPLANLANDAGQDYVVAGVHDALINELAQAGIAVIARQSVLRYANTDLPIHDIASALDLDAVIEGSVRPSADSLGVSLRLIDARTEEPLWSGSFDRHLRDAGSLYRDATEAIAGRVARHGGGVGSGDVRQVNPDAYRAYLQGLSVSQRLTPQSMDAAQGYFEAALGHDPHFALAHAGIARVWLMRVVLGVSSPGEAGPLARAAIGRAMDADSASAEVLGTLAGVQTYISQDWEAAERTYRRVVSLNPSGADTRAGYAQFLHLMGRLDEALAEIEKALELDPYNPQPRLFFGQLLMQAGRYDEALVQYRQILSLVPDHPVAHSMLWATYHLLGQDDAALESALTFFTIRSPELAAGMREAATRGREEAGYAGALTRIAELMAARSDSTYMSPMHIARLYTYAGNVDSAFAWLDRAVDAGEPNTSSLAIRPDFESLRDDPRFEALLGRLGLRGETAPR